MPALTIETGAKAGQRVVLKKSMVVGRGLMADLDLGHPTVSRRHAMLNWADNECVLLDLESENGTYVNDRRVRDPLKLRGGDRIRWGDVLAHYDDDADGGRKRDVSLTSTSVHLIQKPKTESRVLMTMSIDEAELERLRAKQSVAARVSESRRLLFFRELGEVATETFDTTTVMDFVLERFFSLLPQTERAFVMRWNERTETLEPGSARARDGSPEEPAASHTLLKDVIEKRQGILVADVTQHPKYAGVRSIVDTNLRTIICAPLIFNDEIFGVIQVDSTRSGAPFAKDDLALLLAVSSQVASTLAYANLHARLVQREILEHDMLLARRIQQHFLPEEGFSREGYDFALEYSPALEVGGDYYSFLDLERGRIGVAVGDVSGKGVSAALYMAKVASEMRYQASAAREPGELLERLNDALASTTPEGMFITLVLVTLDLADGTLAVANAGHLQPLVREANGGIVALGRPGGLPLGVVERASYEQFEYEIEPTDRIVIFTDGITEAMNAKGQMFGDERLSANIERSSGEVSDIVSSVVKGLKRFVGDAPQYDDITLVCFGRKAC